MVTSARLATPPATTTDNAIYPWLPWRDVRSYVNDQWDLENTPHHSIIGLTGSGKSYLARYGLLELSSWDRVLIIDTKGDDPIISRTGRPVSKFPRRAWYSGLGQRHDQPGDQWFRLVVNDNIAIAKEQVHEALSTAYDEGDWVIYVDECWDVTNRKPDVGLGLEGIMAKIWRKGRGRHVSLIAATQTPVEVPRLFYDQASFAWIGRIRDEDRQKRLLEIGGLAKRDLPALSTLKRRQWLLAADNGEYFARTMVERKVA